MPPAAAPLHSPTLQLGGLSRCSSGDSQTSISSGLVLREGPTASLHASGRLHSPCSPNMTESSARAPLHPSHQTGGCWGAPLDPGTGPQGPLFLCTHIGGLC